MSLSLRGLLIAFPIVALIIGGMALFTYQSAISDFRADAASEIIASNDAAAHSLRDDLDLIAETKRKAATMMVQRMRSGALTDFDEVFTGSADGAFHSRSGLWDGAELSGSVRLQGFGGFVAPPRPEGQRSAAVMAAFDTIKAMANGLPDDIESLYFFSPSNDLLIYAPKREDRLEFYREAPADFGFQEAEFSSISSLKENPEGVLRCTSLQTPIYDSSGQNWTTGCMLPVRVDGRHVGAWGISIPLVALTQSLPPPMNGATTVIASSDGKLIHHSGLTEETADRLAANIDMATSDDPMLRGLLGYLDGGIDGRVEHSGALGAYISAEKLAAPDWVVFTILPNEALSDRAWSIAQRVIGVAIAGALLLGLILTGVFHRTVARRISRLADRTDQIAEAGDMENASENGDEIHRLERAFDSLEERLDQARTRESRSFDILVDAAEDYAMVLYDRDGSLLRANEGALALFGANGIARLGEKFVLGPADMERSPTGQQPSTQRRTFERTLEGGRKAWLEETIIPLTDENGDAFGTAYIAHDLTTLRNAQREAENNLLYLEMAQSSAQAGHFVLDPDTMNLSLSPWLRDRLGLADASLPLSQVPSIIDQDRREKTMAEIAEAIEAKSDFAFETLAIGAAGNRFPALIRGTTVFDDHAEDQPARLIGYYGIVQDISEQKDAAEALLHALDEAKAEARARSEILAVISHEIRTPISGILGLIDQIRRERSATERSRALTLIEDSSDALLKTLDATLNRTRSERDRSEETNEEFSPASLVERIAELFRPLARRKGLAIELDGTVSERARGKPARIQQILANFVSNAIKFTSTGGITVACTAPNDSEPRWTFSVTDTGGGITPERMKTIFEPFSGSAPDTLGRSAGSGLGLSITRQLADELGGIVEAEAANGGGTCMILKVPLETVAAKTGGQKHRGTIAIHLNQASLAVRTEAIAEGCGFAVGYGQASGGANIVVSDDPAILADSAASLRILVVDEDTQLSEKRFPVIKASQLADRLRDVLDEYDDE